ncbi:MAG: PIN domain nuclease [Anaerolineaceae bacterium]|nr:PIN domain nuclease [Anaerolineaceae bacterium]
MSVDFIFRLIGMVVFTIIGVFIGTNLGAIANSNPDAVNPFTVEQYAFTIGLVGALFGLILTPILTTRPIRAIRALLTRVSAQSLFASFAGLIAGLIIAALLAFPLSLLPSPFGSILPFVGVVVFAYLGVSVFVMRQTDLFNVIPGFGGRGGPGLVPDGNVAGEPSMNWAESRNILLDTSVIIDGRISDIARTGFLPGSLLIPRFVLNELQYIADSADGLRRQRGRRGMEVLAALQKEPSIPVRISDIDVEGVREVDDKLVILARQLRCPVLTNDYNLNRIAELQGVTVLNINELANAVKTVLLPGEVMNVRVIQDGKESNQGVGYMDDGTMVVVENGRDYMDKEIIVIVTKVLQTAAGRMIFARPENGEIFD